MSSAAARNDVRARLSRLALASAGPLLIVAVTLSVYRGYLNGSTSPNWDFFSSYLTSAHSWWDLGGFFDPPTILPYVLGGTPAYLDLQNSAWYLPVGIVANTMGYGSHSAAALQALTICFGALGVFVLCRRWMVSSPAATLAGVAFAFAPGFISNAQHVDIVRAWAFLPWLFVALSTTSPRWWAYPLSVLLWFQFFVGAYPGSIASAAYLCGLWVVGVVIGRPRHEQLRYVVWLGCTIAPALLMSAIKWAPYLASRPQSDSTNQVVVTPEILATVIFPFQTATLPNDVTMRSFFVVPIMLVLAFFARYRQRFAILVLASTLGSLVLGIDTIIWSHWQEDLPLLDVSRFRTTDFKVGFVLGLVLLGSLGADRLLFPARAHHPISSRQVGQRTTLAAAVVGGICVVGVTGGFDVASAKYGLMWIVGSAAVVTLGFFIANMRVREGQLLRARLASDAPVLLALLCVVFVGWSAANLFENGWNTDRLATEELYWGSTASSLVGGRAPLTADRRPERSGPAFPVAQPIEFTTQAWNTADLSRRPSLGGGANLKGQLRYEQLVAMATDPGAAPTMRTLAEPGQGWLAPGALPRNQYRLTACLQDGSCTSTDARVTPAGWGPNRISYEVSTPQPGVLIVNEVAWPGWAVVTCPSAGGPCTERSLTTRESRVFLSTPLAAGSHKLTFVFHTPRARLSWVLFSLGVAIALATSLGIGVRSLRGRPAHIREAAGGPTD
jgi:hypothetical protein